MFRSSKAAAILEQSDLSGSLNNASNWRQGDVAELGLVGEIGPLAYDPVSGLLAVATAGGHICLFGRPGVFVSWFPRPTHPVKYLAFRPNSPYLISIDSKETLYLWDLSEVDPKTQEPKRRSIHSLRSNATCLETSPTLFHVLIGFKDGSIDCYDTETRVLAPYRISNQWLEQEELLRRSGVPGAPSRRHIPYCVDVKFHPTNLNLLLIAYEGGIVLWNWKDKKAERFYDLVFPPGAPGGNKAGGEDLFSERRPVVTSIVWRPDGLVFAVGYDDGSIGFWALDNEDKPITVRTFDAADVHLANAENLFDEDDDAGFDEEDGHQPALREPIFKLSWSAFPSSSIAESLVSKFTASNSHQSDMNQYRDEDENRLSGATMLTVLGGLLPNDPLGVHVLTLPPFTASKMFASQQSSTDPAVHDALRQSVEPLSRTFYSTPTPAEDFLLLPRSSLNGSAFDPSAIVIVQSPNPTLPDNLSTIAPKRGLSAFSFPPHPNRPPMPFSLPSILRLSGEMQFTKCKLELCSGPAYTKLVSMRKANEFPDLPLHGGRAVPRRKAEERSMHGPSPVLENRKILVMAHPNLNITFWDISSTLLSGKGIDGSVQQHYPTLLATIDMRPLLLLSKSLVAAQLYRSTPNLVTVTDFSASVEATEIAIALSTGEIIFYRYGQLPDPGPEGHHPTQPLPRDASEDSLPPLQDMNLDRTVSRRKSLFSPIIPRRSSRRPSSIPTAEHIPKKRMQVVDLRHTVSTGGQLVFSPILALPAASEQCTAVSLSHIGFLSASWSDGTVAILDLRDSEILFQHAFADQRCKLLTWAVTPVEHDLEASLRLFAAFEDGTTQVMTLTHSLQTWLCQTETVFSLENHSLAQPLAVFLYDYRGRSLADPDGHALQRILNHDTSAQGQKDELNSILVIASRSAVQIFANCGSAKSAKWEAAQPIVAATTVYREGAGAALHLLQEDGISVGLSLPSLEEVYRSRNLTGNNRFVSKVVVSSEGDAVEFEDSILLVSTVFDLDRFAFPPGLTLHHEEQKIIDNPAAESLFNNVSAWFGTNIAMTPAGLDAIIGGPNRPAIMPKAAVPKPTTPKPGTPVNASKAEAAAPAGGSWWSSLTSNTEAKNTLSFEQKKDQILASEAPVRSQMDVNRELLEQRGERLDWLNDSMNNISQGASDALKNAKSFGLKQGLKSKLDSYM